MRRGLSSWSAWASALAFFLAGLFPLFNADAYGHLAQGRQIDALGRVPQVDLFSIWKPEPQPWKNYEWAYDLLSWWIYERLGANALILLKCLALGALGYLLVLLATRLARGATLAGPLAVSALLLALPVARFRFTVRPQILGLLFPAVLLLGIYALYDEETSSRRKAWLLAGLTSMQLVWVNSHGSHLFGLAVTLIFTLLSIRSVAFRWMLALLSLQALSTALTPFGFAIVTDAVAHVFRPEYRELLVEWSPWTPEDPLRLLIAPIVTSLFVLLAMRPVARSSRFGLGYAVFSALLCLMAFRSMRFVAHQLLFCAPFIAAGLARFDGFASLRRSAPVLVGVSAIVSGLWMSQIVPSLGFGLGEPKREYPWASAELIETEVEAPRLLASLQDSWVLMFAAPGAKLLIDGRVPFYGPEMIQRVLQSFSDTARFAALLSEFEINTVVIDHTRADQIAATELLRTRDDWVLAFVEDGHSLFVRRDAAPSLAPFRILGPGYRTGDLLEPQVEAAELKSELSRLGTQLNTATIHAWHEGLALLRPLARQGDRAGIRKHETPDERVLAEAAYERLGVVADAFPGFTTVEVYRSMAALAACRVREARSALGRALYGGPTREASLVRLELFLRAGDERERAGALDQLERLRVHPESARDPWVLAIAKDVEVRCP